MQKIVFVFALPSHGCLSWWKHGRPFPFQHHHPTHRQPLTNLQEPQPCHSRREGRPCSHPYNCDWCRWLRYARVSFGLHRGEAASTWLPDEGRFWSFGRRWGQELLLLTFILRHCITAFNRSVLCGIKLCITDLYNSTLCFISLCIMALCIVILCVSTFCITALHSTELYTSTPCIVILCIILLCIIALWITAGSESEQSCERLPSFGRYISPSVVERKKRIIVNRRI